MNKTKKMLAVFISASMILAFAGCGTSSSAAPAAPASSAAPAAPAPASSAAPAPSEPAAKLKQLPVQIVGGTSGGTYFLMANAVAQILNSKLPELFKASAQSSSGTPVIIRLLEEGEAEFGIGQAGVVADALSGAGVFEGNPFTNLKAVMFFYPNVMQVIYRKSVDIKSFKDFKGKTFCVGASGSATELNARDMFDAVGLSYDDCTIEYTSEAQSVELLKNRQADGANMIAALGSASMIDLTSSGDFAIYKFSEEELNDIINFNPSYYRTTIPGGQYSGYDSDIETWAVANNMHCRADLEDEYVYQFTKAIFENLEDLVNAHAIGKNISHETALNGLTAPLHPGAERYYKEVGVIK